MSLKETRQKIHNIVEKEKMRHSRSVKSLVIPKPYYDSNLIDDNYNINPRISMEKSRTSIKEFSSYADDEID